MKTNKWLQLVFLMMVFLISCSKEDSTPSSYVPQGDFDSGVLVLNEGSYLTPNASMSYISFDLSRTQNDIFLGVNPGVILGDTAQSIGFNGSLAYIVVNASNKIEIVNRYTLVKVGEITSGFISPRYIAFANGKGYVTDWGTGAGAGTIKVIDLGTKSVVSTITVDDFPNTIIENNGKLYVAHNDLGSKGNSISIIDSSTNNVSGSITTGSLPDEMRIDGNNLWVSCFGVTSYPVEENESAGKIQKINLDSNTVVLTLTQGSNTQHVSFMDIFGSNLYYVVNKDVFKMTVASNALPTSPAFTTTVQYIYAFAVKNNKIFIGDAKTFDVNGSVNIYSSGDQFDPNPIGTLLKTVEVGVGPNGFYFNQ
jgi:hypothetical protein